MLFNISSPLDDLAKLLKFPLVKFGDEFTI